MNFTNRILIVDDTPEIHEDFRKILAPSSKASHTKALEKLELALFEGPGKPSSETDAIHYRIESASQGEDAIALVQTAAKQEDPYAVIFMDVRMPPGINGVETMVRVWESYPLIEIVIVSAYSDYSWEEILARVGLTDHLMFLRKPFDQASVKQMALSLTRKFNLNRHLRAKIQKIEDELQTRCHQLANMLTELKTLS